MIVELSIFLVITICGTYLYSISSIANVVFLILLTVLAVFYLIFSTRRSMKKNRMEFNLTASLVTSETMNHGIPDKFRILEAGPNIWYGGWIWLGWLFYGLIFKEIDFGTYNDPIAFTQSSIIIGLVVLTYIEVIRQNLLYTSLVALFYALLLFIPHTDSRILNTGLILITVKLFCFIILFCVIQFCKFVASFRSNPSSSSSSKKSSSKSSSGSWPSMASVIKNDEFIQYYTDSFENFREAELTCIQSSWVLFVTRWSIFLVIVQFVPLFIQFVSAIEKYENIRKEIASVLPTKVGYTDSRQLVSVKPSKHGQYIQYGNHMLVPYAPNGPVIREIVDEHQDNMEVVIQRGNSHHYPEQELQVVIHKSGEEKSKPSKPKKERESKTETLNKYTESNEKKPKRMQSKEELSEESDSHSTPDVKKAKKKEKKDDVQRKKSLTSEDESSDGSTRKKLPKNKETKTKEKQGKRKSQKTSPIQMNTFSSTNLSGGALLQRLMDIKKTNT
jgi:hypothetical protein